MGRDYWERRGQQQRQREWQARLEQIREAIQECVRGNVTNFCCMELLHDESLAEEDRVCRLIARALDVSIAEAGHLYEVWQGEYRRNG